MVQMAFGGDPVRIASCITLARLDAAILNTLMDYSSASWRLLMGRA